MKNVWSWPLFGSSALYFASPVNRRARAPRSRSRRPGRRPAGSTRCRTCTRRGSRTARCRRRSRSPRGSARAVFSMTPLPASTSENSVFVVGVELVDALHRADVDARPVLHVDARLGDDRQFRPRCCSLCAQRTAPDSRIPAAYANGVDRAAGDDADDAGTTRGREAGMHYAFVFEKVAVVIGPWWEPGDPPEHGARVELRFRAAAPHRGSASAAQRIVIDQPLFRADLFDQLDGPVGNLRARPFPRRLRRGRARVTGSGRTGYERIRPVGCAGSSPTCARSSHGRACRPSRTAHGTTTHGSTSMPRRCAAPFPRSSPRSKPPGRSCAPTPTRRPCSARPERSHSRGGNPPDEEPVLRDRQHPRIPRPLALPSLALERHPGGAQNDPCWLSTRRTGSVIAHRTTIPSSGCVTADVTKHRGLAS